MKHSVAYFFIYNFSIVFVCLQCTLQNLSQPCFFLEESNLTLLCRNLTDDDIFQEIIPLFADSEFETFNISNSVLTYIPSDAETFKNTSTIYVAQTSLIFMFADIPPSKLDTIIMDEVEFKLGMSWEYFEELHTLKSIIIRNVDIRNLDAEFERSVTRWLEMLIMQNTNTSFMSETVFRKFIYLSDLRIESSRIKKLRRDMFPRPAEVLKTLSFEDNMISYLPKDLFAEMPNLKIVDFSYNYIKEIPVSLFRNTKYLDFISFEGNPLNCDCHMRWIVWKNITWEETFDRQLEGVCQSPRDVTGVELQALAPKDFAHCPKDNFLSVLKTTTRIHANRNIVGILLQHFSKYIRKAESKTI